MFHIFAQIHTSCYFMLKEIKRDIGSTMEIAGGVFISQLLNTYITLKLEIDFLERLVLARVFNIL